MTMAAPRDDTMTAQIITAENERIAALLAGDARRVGQLLSEDLIHVHASARVETKQAYLEGLSDRLAFLRIERGEPTVRTYGEAAVMTGTIDQHVWFRQTDEERHIRVFVTQIWIMSERGWQLTSFHACHLPV